MKKLAVVFIAVAALATFAADEEEDAIAGLIHHAKERGWTAQGLAVGLDRLDRWYQANQQNAKFREDLNGGLVEVRIDTNDLVKVYVYSNGTEYVEKFQRVEPRPLEKRLSAAELRKEREAKEQARRDARIRQLEDPQSFTVECAKLMKRNDWPEELARLYLNNELRKLRVEYVDVVIGAPK